MYFCDIESKSFLHAAINEIPDDAIPLTDEQYEQIFTAVSQGAELVVDDNGILMIEPRPSSYHNWDGERWVFKESNLAQKIRDKKAEKLKEINAKAQDFVRKVAGFDDVPDYEIKTWQMQGAEAKAWKLNQSAPTPTLDLIAQTRGVPADILKQKAYEKTIKFERLTAFIAGKRQGYEDANKAAKTLDDIEKINPIYSVGG